MNKRQESFLQAIIADPDNDLPRLIYADALDDGTGGFPAFPPLAEFIRVHCELAKTYSCPGTNYNDTCYWCAQSVVVDPQRVGPGYKECGHRCTFRHRERQLLPEIWPVVLAGLPVAGVALFDQELQFPNTYFFRRGLPERICISGLDFHTRQKILTTRFPLRKVILAPPYSFSIKYLSVKYPKIRFEYGASGSVSSIRLSDLPIMIRGPS